MVNIKRVNKYVHGQVAVATYADLRIITDYHKKMHFRWWNVFNDMCEMGRWSYWSWFDVNRSTFDEDMFPVTLTFVIFRPRICSQSHGYSCPALCFHYDISFYNFLISPKSEGQDGRTDGGTDGVPS